jgi:PKD repeat protein
MIRKLVSGAMLTLLLGSMLSSAIILVKGETETHDLEVDLEDTLKAPHHLSSGNSTVLNATVVNKGDFNESDVVLQLLINDTMVLYATTPSLEINCTFWTAYFWTAEDADYNLTVYAPRVNGEDNVTNNVVTKWVRVCPDQPPIANFTYSPPPPDPGPIMKEDVIFNASDSYDPDWGTILNYTWNFGDENRTTVNHPIVSHKYTEYGEYNVTLTLADTENLTSLPKWVNITVYARPIASFRIDKPRPLPDPYFVNETLTFNATASDDPDNSTALNKGIVNYTWNFRDGNITSTPNPIINHTYTTEKDYNVILTVTDYHGLISKGFSRLVRVSLGRPIADFTPPPEPCYVCYPLTFDASASYDPNNKTAPNKGIVNYRWIFGDGNIISTPNSTIKHHYQENGTYNVNLTVTDYEGLTDFTNKTVTVSLEVLVKVVDGETGNTTIIHNPEETFTVNITIANVENLKSFEFKLVWPPEWLPPEYYLLGYETMSEGNFLGPQRYPNGTERWRKNYVTEGEGYVHVNYSFTPVVSKEERSGNGTLVAITFLVKSSGNATLNLDETILLDSLGNPIDHSAEDGYFYTRTPVANFTWSEPAVPNENVTFDASSSYDPGNYTAPNHGIANYTWNFDDGTPPVTTSDPTINHTFTDFGTYTVNLTVTDYDKETWWIQYQVLVGSRDVAITDVEPSPFAFNETLGGYETNGDLPISVTVKNHGDFRETFNVTVYADDEELGTQNVTLEAGQSNNLIFHLYAFRWNETHGLPKGDYNISANATLVKFDINPRNNCREDGVVRVYLAGDINNTGAVDIDDLLLLIDAFWGTPSTPNWNPNADLNDDGVVGIDDLLILIDHFWEH